MPFAQQAALSTIHTLVHLCTHALNCLVYRLHDLCDKVRTTQSHALHTLLGLHHLAVCALVLRTMVTLFWIHLEWGDWQVRCRVREHGARMHGQCLR